MLLNTLLLALRSIRRNLLRSFLTILGIVIGVSAVITMVTLGNGATMAVQNQISSLGTNLLQVRPGQRMGPGGGGGRPRSSRRPTPTPSPADRRHRRRGARGAHRRHRGGQRPQLDHQRHRQHQRLARPATGSWHRAANFRDDELRAGAAVCLIGETVRRELFGTPTVGEQLRVKQFSCEVVGVLASKGQGALGNDQDDTVVVPLQDAAAARHRQHRVNTLLVSMQDGSDSRPRQGQPDAAAARARKLADTDDDNFNVLRHQAAGRDLSGTTKVLTTLLGAVAAVSLLVGGIGIMNIMLVSVTERTREIGLRLAIGALEREVLLQFLIEAVVLASLGGLIGIVLATGASMGWPALMEVPYLFNPASTCCRSCSRPPSAWCSATSRPAARRAWTRSTRCGTSERGLTLLAASLAWPRAVSTSCRTRQRHAHAALGKALGLAEQAQVGAGHAQGFVHAVEHDACGVHAAVDHGAGAGAAQAGVHRQAQDGAGVQLEFALPLRAHA
jgi:putative ABC transport system permease protein